MLRDAVVAQVVTTQGVHQGDGFARRSILVAECAGGGNRQVVTTDLVVEHSTGHRDSGARVAVIRLVGRSDATQYDGFLADAGIRGLSRGQTVVGGQSAVLAIGQCDAVDRHQIRARHILAVERGRAAGGHGFRANQTAADGQGRRCGSSAVVGFVVGGGRSDQRFGRDRGGGGSGGVIQHVVGEAGSAQHDANDVHGFSNTGILVRKSAAGRGDAQAVAADQTGKAGGIGIERGDGAAVIRLVAGGDAGHGADGGFVNVGRCGGRRATQRVVTDIISAQAETADIHCLAIARIPVGKRAAGRSQA